MAIAPLSAIEGDVVSTTKALVAARFDTGVNTDIAFDAASAIVPEIEETVRSDEVSPD